MTRFLPVAIAALALLSGCANDLGEEPAASSSTALSSAQATSAGPFQVSSPTFRPGEPIPSRHSCDAENVSPALGFANPPRNASHLALIMEDPDAPSGTVLHWTFWDLPSNATALPEAADPHSYGAREGQSYRGPCPPVGTHRYFFYAFATDGPLALAEGSDVDQLRAALRGHVAVEAQMYGTYTRPQIPTYGP